MAIVIFIGIYTHSITPLISLPLPASPRMCTEPHCGREILFPINVVAVTLYHNRDALPVHSIVISLLTKEDHLTK